MRTIYFDSSAFSQLWRSKNWRPRELLRARRRLLSKLFGARPRIIIGPTLISEIARIHGRELGQEELAFLRALPDARFLKDVRERVKAELQAVRGEPNSPFVTPEFQRALLDKATRMPEMWAAEDAQLHEDKRVFINEERKARDGILSDAGGQQEVATNVRRWFADSEATTVDWAQGFMERNLSDLGLGSDRSAWPDPRGVPTIWGICAYRTAQIMLSNRDARKIDGNDLPDWRHYASAMHADCLVVDDLKFRAIAKASSPPKPEIVTSDELLELVLGGARGPEPASEV